MKAHCEPQGEPATGAVGETHSRPTGWEAVADARMVQPADGSGGGIRRREPQRRAAALLPAIGWKRKGKASAGELSASCDKRGHWGGQEGHEPRQAWTLPSLWEFFSILWLVSQR